MVITFSKKYYDLPAIKNAVEAYQGLAIFKIKTSKNNFLIEAGNIDEEMIDVFEDEFCNFVLSVLKSEL